MARPWCTGNVRQSSVSVMLGMAAATAGVMALWRHPDHDAVRTGKVDAGKKPLLMSSADSFLFLLASTVLPSNNPAFFK